MKWLCAVASVFALLLVGGSAQAKCREPRGCWVALCSRPGNVVELTFLGGSADGGLRVRVDAVHVVETGFAEPAVGDELTISPSPYAGPSPVVGDSLVGVTQGPGNNAWLVLTRVGDEVSCPESSRSTALSIDDIVAVIRSGDCDGDPLPNALQSCDDDGGGCSGGAPLPWAFGAMVIGVFLLRRRRSRGAAL